VDFLPNEGGLAVRLPTDEASLESSPVDSEELETEKTRRVALKAPASRSRGAMSSGGPRWWGPGGRRPSDPQILSFIQ